MSTNKKTINVICIYWGVAYNHEDVNRLYKMIKNNTSYKVNFYCFTNDSKGIDKNITIKDLPILNTKKEYQRKYAYQKEAGLCDDDLGELRNKRVFFFDLDVLIVSNLDELFSFPEDKKFYIIKDWNSKSNTVGQASCYSWVVGTLGYVKEYYEKNPEKVLDKFSSASQEYLSSKVIERYGSLNFWPKEWFCSFRFHCMCKIGPLRHFITPKIPKNKNLKVIVFHGTPKPKDALEGRWELKKQKWKRIYKVCKPTKWIEDYWK